MVNGCRLQAENATENAHIFVAARKGPARAMEGTGRNLISYHYWHAQLVPLTEDAHSPQSSLCNPASSAIWADQPYYATPLNLGTPITHVVSA